VTTQRHPGRPEAPGPLLQLLEARAWLEAGASLALMPLWRLSPHGDGHPVLVLPGLGAGDRSTAILRMFLASRGYAVSAWGEGRNLGFRHGVFDAHRSRIEDLSRRHGRKVSLVGWSLGGIFARELGKRVRAWVRQVITLGSPFTGHPRATHAFRLYEWASGRRVGDPWVHEPSRSPPPVPTTSIWSRTDGVVDWRCSVEREQPMVENIEINASHLGIGTHPLALYAIADRLALPEGQWRPFRREGWKVLAYGDAQHEPQVAFQ